MVVELEDPVTDVSYDLGTPIDTVMKVAVVIGGLTMTLLAFSVAQGQVLPAVMGMLSDVTGGIVTGDAVDAPGTNGGGL